MLNFTAINYDCTRNSRVGESHFLGHSLVRQHAVSEFSKGRSGFYPSFGKTMVLQRIMWPSTARTYGQLEPWCSQQTHHCPNQPHQAFTPQPQLPLISRPAEGRRLSWPERTVGQQLAQGCLQQTGCQLNLQPLSYESNTLSLHHCTHC